MMAWIRGALGKVYSKDGLAGVVVLVVLVASLARVFGVDVAGIVAGLMGGR